MALKTLNRRNKKDLKWPKIIIAILSTIGIVDTGSITLKNWGLFTSLSCPGIQNGCETVLNSPWGTLFENNQVNIPLSLAGFITYLSILFITIILSLNLISPKEKLNKFLWWLLFLMFRVLRAIQKESLLFTLSILILSWHESYIRNAV